MRPLITKAHNAMMNSNTNLTILSTSIRQDAEGRYCLNDCHKASGSDKKNGPSYWLATDQAQALVIELTDTGNPVSPVSAKRGGTNQGTYACKELVYAYAMWISPAFHLQVIRAFDALVTGQIAATNHKSVTVADMEKQVRSAVGGIIKGVVNKALEPHITYAKLLEAKMDALIAKADQALVLMDRPAPAPSTIVSPYRGAVHATCGDEDKILSALTELGGKASIRELSRRLCWLASRRDAALESLCEEGVIAFDRGKGSTPRGGRPDKGSVRLLQIPFAHASA